MLDGFSSSFHTTFIDSSSLGVLIGAHRRLKRRGGTMVVVCDNDAIVKTFRITGHSARGVLAAYLSAHRTMSNGSALCAALAVTERD